MPSLDPTDFQFLAENSADMICRVDLNQVLHYVSPSCLHILGWTPEEMVGTGPDAFVPAEDIPRIAEAVARGDYQRGIVLGGSGNGEAIVANRVKGVRCGVCWTDQVTIWSRAHNDSNCISMGTRTISLEDALRFVQIWLTTPFEGGRHIARIRKIDGG